LITAGTAGWAMVLAAPPILSQSSEPTCMGAKDAPAWCLNSCTRSTQNTQMNADNQACRSFERLILLRTQLLLASRGCPSYSPSKQGEGSHSSGNGSFGCLKAYPAREESASNSSAALCPHYGIAISATKTKTRAMPQPNFRRLVEAAHCQPSALSAQWVWFQRFREAKFLCKTQRSHG